MISVHALTRSCVCNCSSDADDHNETGREEEIRENERSGQLSTDRENMVSGYRNLSLTDTHMQKPNAENSCGAMRANEDTPLAD